MILSCPNCGTRYVLDPARLRPAGRVVRCARCSHSWAEPAPPVSPDEVPEVAPPPPPVEQEPATPRAAEEPVRPLRRPPSEPERRNLPALPRKRGLGTALGWLSLVLFLVVLVGGTLLFPAEITRTWPPARQLYEVLGLDSGRSWLDRGAQETARPSPIDERLRFADLTPSQRFIDGVLTLVITGRVENIGQTTETVPPIEVVLLDSRRLDLRTWIVEAPQQVLAPGASASFETRLENPPPEAQDISVTFAVGATTAP